MITLGEYMKSVQGQIRSEIETFLNVQIASGALGFIDTRIRQTGQKATGGNFSPYSSNPTFIAPDSFTSKTYSDKVFKQLKGKRKDRRLVAKDGGAELEWRKVKGHNLSLLPGGYKRIREIETRNVQFKDFERTSELWKSIHIEGVPQEVSTNQISPGYYRTVIGTSNQRSIKIMEGIKDKEDVDFLAVSQSEQQKLANLLADKLQTIMA